MGALWPIIEQDGRQPSKLSRRRRGNGRSLAEKGMRLAAEVLEPRCLMTNSTGLDGATVAPSADDTADPVTSEVSTNAEPTRPAGVTTILVDASLWDDRGLTVLQVDDWVHVVRTGTDLDVVPPIPVAEPVQLMLQGRDNASDVLALQVFTRNIVVQFDGGIGAGTDIMGLDGLPGRHPLAYPFDPRFQIAGPNEFSSVSSNFWRPTTGWSRYLVQFRDTELVSVSEDPSFGLSRVVVELNDADNDVTIFGDSARHAMYITDAISGTALQLKSDYLSIDGRSGNDRIAVAGSISEVPGDDDDEHVGFGILGGGGNDTLIGGRGADWLNGEAGNDSILAGDGDDHISGGEGVNSIDGGEGNNGIWESGGGRSVLVGADLISGWSGLDRFVNVQNVTISCSFEVEELIDDPTCPALVTVIGPLERGRDGDGRSAWFASSYEYGGAFHSLSPEEQKHLLLYAAEATGNHLWYDFFANDRISQTSASSDERSDEGGDDNPTSDLANLTANDVSDNSVIPNSTASAEDMASDNDQPRADLLGQGLTESTAAELLETPTPAEDSEMDLSDLDAQDNSEPDATSADPNPTDLSWDELLANADFLHELVSNNALTLRAS